MKILLFTLSLCYSLLSFAKPIASNEQFVTPLLNGQSVPEVNVTTMDNRTVSLKSILAKQKTILFFYRGGWCPFCNTQMGQLKAIEPKLTALGYQLIGISTDSVADLQMSMQQKQLPYQLLSDYNSTVSQAFGLAYFTSAQVTKRYIAAMQLTNPLQKNAEGQARLVLPAPAVYIFDQQGLVHFSYVNINYKIRLQPELLLAAAKLIK